ncbi:putative FMN/FAD exporter YeeO [Vibrio stylophorae]|uniref:Multidrug resistance protein NorM n=1 Tax=Vibrio stylophorae TaxID=659351 RepID=A0ABM8ZQ32_9VIBR|nr:MATE family efflux transporter [Vibrio stylophorae]CAH0532405.1 putative FMN/FAD exporter YeeO [Vibrio stylophorae]
MQHNNRTQDKHGLLSGPIPDTLRHMAIPMALGMISVLMFNLVDTFFVSLLGTKALAAMSFTFPVTFGLNSITMGLGVGLLSCLGQRLGKHQQHHDQNQQNLDHNQPSGATQTNHIAPYSSASNSRASQILCSHGIIFIVLIAIALSALLLVAQPILFRGLGAKPDIAPLLHQYLTIWLWMVPLLALPMACSSAIRATGDTKTPAMIMMLAGGINGGLDPLLIFGWGPVPAMGIGGAALASGLSWLVASILSLWIMVRRYQLLSWPKINGWLTDCKSILAVGLPAAASNLLVPLASAVMMIILAKQGTEAVAAYGAAARVEAILLLVMFSMASVLTPFMAQNIGAKQTERAYQGLVSAVKFAFAFQLLVYIAMVPLSWPLAMLFSQEPAVQSLLWLYLVIVPISYGLQGVTIQLVGSLNALKKSHYALLCNLTRLFGLMIPCAWLGSLYDGTQGLFIGIAIANAVSGLVSLWWVWRLKFYLSSSR